MNTQSKWAAAIAALCFAGTPQAALVNVGNGSVLDTETALFWVDNWSLSGFQTWETQRSWAENLTLAGSSDWHLPTLEQYATLYAGLKLNGLALPSRFSNVLPTVYWSSTEVPLDPSSALMFLSDSGLQVSASKAYPGYAAAVRSATLPVPEPTGLALTALGLLAAGLARARQSRRAGPAQKREGRLHLETD